MSIFKNNCIILVIVDKNIKKLVEKYAKETKCSISKFCSDAIWDKIYFFKHRKEDKKCLLKI